MRRRIKIETALRIGYSKHGCRCRLNKGGILFGRTRYQGGSLRLEERKRGPAVWVYRWWEKDTEGKPIRRKAQLGNLDEYPNESKAQAAADALRLTINEQTPRQQLKEITIATLVQPIANTRCRTFSPKSVRVSELFASTKKDASPIRRRKLTRAT